jgi:hypothetical protein
MIRSDPGRGERGDDGGFAFLDARREPRGCEEHALDLIVAARLAWRGRSR